MAHLTNFSFEFFYKMFTDDASLPLLYHGAKKSNMTKNSNQGGSCLKSFLQYLLHAVSLLFFIPVDQSFHFSPESIFSEDSKSSSQECILLSAEPVLAHYFLSLHMHFRVLAQVCNKTERKRYKTKQCPVRPTKVAAGTENIFQALCYAHFGPYSLSDDYEISDEVCIGFRRVEQCSDIGGQKRPEKRFY